MAANIASATNTPAADIGSATVAHLSPHSSPTRKRADLFADYNPDAPARPRESGFVLAASPTIGEIHSLRSPVRTNSDVQGLVKRFEHLDVRDREAESAERRKRHEAELRRALVAREEAEGDVKRLREEVRKLKKEGDEGRDRERKVAKRLEVVMEEYTNFKGAQASQVAGYEKEVRKARKEAFKSSSAVLKLQEELKSARNSLKVSQQNLDLEKRKVQQKDQDAFDARYQLVSLQEEVEKLKSHVKIVEDEREALKLSLKEEEVTRIAAEGMIALPVDSLDDQDILMTSPKRRYPDRRPPPQLFSEDKENMGVVTKKFAGDDRLEAQLNLERTKRQYAEELAEFLELECQFRCCRCRSHQHDSAFKISSDFALAMDRIRQDMRVVVAKAHSPLPNSPEATKAASEEKNEKNRTSAFSDHEAQPEMNEDIEMEHVSEHTVTSTPVETGRISHATHDLAMVDEEEPREILVNRQGTTPPAVTDTPSPAFAVALELEREQEPATRESSRPSPIQSVSPMLVAQPLKPNPPRPSVRTVTTTTTIPMQFTPAKPVAVRNIVEDAENIPPTATDLVNDVSTGPQPAPFDREAALAAIAYRRGRAKSIANGHMTPLKQSLEGVSVKERRDISAPILGQKSGPAPLAKGPASVGRAVGRKVA